MHLSDYMAEHGLDDQAVAEAIEVDRSTVSRLRRRETRPGWSTLKKLRAFTRGAVTADDFEEA